MHTKQHKHLYEIPLHKVLMIYEVLPIWRPPPIPPAPVGRADYRHVVTTKQGQANKVKLVAIGQAGGLRQHEANAN
jgi:hypothetical protein